MADPQWILDVEENYKHKIGTVSHLRGPWKDAISTTDNDQLWTVWYYLARLKQGYFTSTQWHEWQKSLGISRVKDGLYHRAPDRHSQNSWDNYLAISTMSNLSDPDATSAREIDHYGNSHNVYGLKYYYNNVRPEQWDSFSPWLGRNPGFVAHLQMCAKIRPGAFFRSIWKSNLRWVLSTMPGPGRHDHWHMAYLQLHVADFGGSDCLSVAKDFYHEFIKLFGPRGFGELMRQYWNRPEHDRHPIEKNWVEKAPW